MRMKKDSETEVEAGLDRHLTDYLFRVRILTRLHSPFGITVGVKLSNLWAHGSLPSYGRDHGTMILTRRGALIASIFPDRTDQIMQRAGIILK